MRPSCNNLELSQTDITKGTFWLNYSNQTGFKMSKLQFFSTVKTAADVLPLELRKFTESLTLNVEHVTTSTTTVTFTILCVQLYYQVVHFSPGWGAHWDLRGTEGEDRWTYWPDVWTSKWVGHVSSTHNSTGWLPPLWGIKNEHSLSPLAHYSLTQS